MRDPQCPFQIGDLAVPTDGVVGPTYVVVDFDAAGTVTVAWRADGNVFERVMHHDMIELA